MASHAWGAADVAAAVQAARADSLDEHMSQLESNLSAHLPRLDVLTTICDLCRKVINESTDKKQVPKFAAPGNRYKKQHKKEKAEHERREAEAQRVAREEAERRQAEEEAAVREAEMAALRLQTLALMDETSSEEGDDVVAEQAAQEMTQQASTEAEKVSGADVDQGEAASRPATTTVAVTVPAPTTMTAATMTAATMTAATITAATITAARPTAPAITARTTTAPTTDDESTMTYADLIYNIFLWDVTRTLEFQKGARSAWPTARRQEETPPKSLIFPPNTLHLETDSQSRKYLGFPSIELTFGSYLIRDPDFLRKWAQDHGFNMVCVECWVDPLRSGCDHMWPCSGCRTKGTECRYVFCPHGESNTTCRYGTICHYLHAEGLRFYAWIWENCPGAAKAGLVKKLEELPNILYLAPPNTVIEGRVDNILECMAKPPPKLAVRIRSIFFKKAGKPLDFSRKNLADLRKLLPLATMDMLNRWCSEEQMALMTQTELGLALFRHLNTSERILRSKGRIMGETSQHRDDFLLACNDILDRIIKAGLPGQSRVEEMQEDNEQEVQENQEVQEDDSQEEAEDDGQEGSDLMTSLENNPAALKEKIVAAAQDEAGGV